MKKNILRATLAVCGMLALTAARADDWSQWRGPRRDGVSREKGLLKSWPKTGPKLLWQIDDIGLGYSTPCAAGNRLYIQSNEGLNDEFVRAFDARNGKRLWSTRLGKVGNPAQQPSYPGARSTPTIDGKFLYALGSDGDLACIALATGKVVWSKSLRADFGGVPGVWAYSESPLIDGNRLIVSPGGESATVVALDKKTGKTLWTSAIPGEKSAGYASSVALTVGGTRQYALYLTRGLAGLDAATGKLLWRFDKTLDTQFSVHAATPIAAGNLVYSAAATVGGVARIAATPAGFVAEPVYVERKAPNSMGGAIKIGDYLYGTTRATLLCTEFATGKVRWEERGIGSGSVCYADGLLYVHGENGDVALVEATPTGYVERGRFAPPRQPERGQSKAWAYPVLAGGKLYLRDLGSLWCYDVRKP